MHQLRLWFGMNQASVRVSIKGSSSWRQHPPLHWTYTAAPQVTCNGGTAMTGLQPGHPAPCCWAEQGPDCTASRLRNCWKTSDGLQQVLFLSTTIYISFFLVKKIKMLLQKDFVLLVNQCIVLTMQNGCQTLGGYFAIKYGNICWLHFKFILRIVEGSVHIMHIHIMSI